MNWWMRLPRRDEYALDRELRFHIEEKVQSLIPPASRSRKRDDRFGSSSAESNR